MVWLYFVIGYFILKLLYINAIQYAMQNAMHIIGVKFITICNIGGSAWPFASNQIENILKIKQ